MLRPDRKNSESEEDALSEEDADYHGNDHESGYNRPVKYR
jgi:hypothetical protein